MLSCCRCLGWCHALRSRRGGAVQESRRTIGASWRFALRLLGGFEVSVAGRAVEDGAWRLRRAKTLLKLLALTPERRLHREQVIEALWPDGESTGKGLHQVLYTARRALASAGDEHVSDRLSLRDDVVTLAGERLTVDIEEFERAAAVAREAKAPATYGAALELYAG